MPTEIDSLLKKTDLFEHVPDVTPATFEDPTLSCVLRETENGFELYIGPPDPYLGGGAVSISLDRDYRYISHVDEELEPCPDDI